MTTNYFLSYSRQDQSLAHKLIEELSKGGVQVWSDDTIRPGENWRKRVEEELRNASLMVVLVTPTSATSPQVSFEVGAAVADGKKIVAVLSEDITHDNIPEYLRNLRWVRESEAREEILRASKAVIDEKEHRGVKRRLNTERKKRD